MVARVVVLATVVGTVGAVFAQEPAGPTERRYDVQDLLAMIRDFPGPNVDAAAGRLVAAEPLDRPPAYESPEALVAAVSDAVGRDTWERPGHAIECANGILTVKAVDETHRRIERCLKDAREPAASLVSVETRFLRAPADFPARVGIDVRGRDMGAGRWAVPCVLVADGETEVLLRAVHQEDRARAVSAPKLTLFNTQRAHSIFSGDAPYVPEYDDSSRHTPPDRDSEIASQLAGGGLCFDVRPRLGTDRRSVTLDLVLTIAHPAGPANASAGAPPRRFDRVELSVALPDQGTALVAGLPDFEGEGAERGGAAGQWPPQAREARLFVLVRATIIELEEEEEYLFR